MFTKPGRPKKDAKPSEDQLPTWFQECLEFRTKRASYFQVDLSDEKYVEHFLSLLSMKTHFRGLGEKSAILMNRTKAGQNIFSLFLFFQTEGRGKLQSIFSSLFQTPQEQISVAAQTSHIALLTADEWDDNISRAEMQAKTADSEGNEEDISFSQKCKKYNLKLQVLLPKLMNEFQKKLDKLGKVLKEEKNTKEKNLKKVSKIAAPKNLGLEEELEIALETEIQERKEDELVSDLTSFNLSIFESKNLKR